MSARNASSSDSVPVCCFSSCGRALRDDAAVVDDRDAVRHAVGFVHVVRGQEDGHAFGLVQMLDVRPELIAALRIEAERRLVEKQDLGRVQQAARDLEAPLHAARELLHERVAAVPQLEQLQQPLDPLVRGRLRGTW